MNLPEPGPILDLIEAFRRSKTMFAATAMGLFDRLADGPADAPALAGDGNAAAMERLLDACVSLGLVERNGGRYQNSPLADVYLRRDSPHSLAGYVRYSNEALFRLWAFLEDAVREGSHRWHQAYGEREDLFSHFFRTPEAQRDFLMGMHGLGMISSPKVAAAFDLGAFERLVDLGGATGHLAAAARRRYPRMRAAVFDLPSVIEFARREGTAPGVELIEGDFFRDPLPRADLYALSRILHDWDEAKIRGLLGRIREALPPGGGLLIAETLLDEDHRAPVSAHMQSLNMLVCTEGRERSLAEYRALLEVAGFSDVEGHRTGGPLDAILARKR
jgi:acetylserotonin N-methyltransferase